MKKENIDEFLLKIGVRKYTEEEIKYYAHNALVKWNEQVIKANEAFKAIEFANNVKDIVKIFPGDKTQAYIWLTSSYDRTCTPYELIEAGEKDKVLKEVKYLREK